MARGGEAVGKAVRLRYSNEVVVPILKSIALIRRLYSWSPVRVYRSSDYTVNVLVVDLGRRQWVLGIYVTLQERKPITPSDVRRMYRLLYARIARYSLPGSRDVSLYILAPRARVTRGAWGAAAAARIVIVKTVDSLRKMLLRYFRARAEGLSRKLFGSLESDPDLWRLAAGTIAVYTALAEMLDYSEVRNLLIDVVHLASVEAFKELVEILGRVVP